MKRRLLGQGPASDPGIVVSKVETSELAFLHSFVMQALGPGIAAIETVRRVHDKQSDSIWKVQLSDGRWSGTYAFLYLNDEGLQAVREGTFDSREPDLDHLAGDKSEVAGIFAWCLVLRGRSKFALQRAAEWLDRHGWCDVPMFTNPVTPHGARLAQDLGFRPMLADSVGLHAIN